MRALFTASVLFLLSVVPSISRAGTDIIKLTTDKPAYYFGENAMLRATLTSKVDNPNMELDIVGLINGFEVPVQRVTDFQFYTQAPLLFPGTFYWVVHVYLQDARLARDLKTSIMYYADRIAAIDLQLQTETNPTVIAALQAERTEKVDMKSACQTQLTAIRSEVAATYITFTIQ